MEINPIHPVNPVERIPERKLPRKQDERDAEKMPQKKVEGELTEPDEEAEKKILDERV